MKSGMAAMLLASISIIMPAAAACAGLTGIVRSMPSPVVSATLAERPLPKVMIGLAAGDVRRFEAATGVRLALNVSYMSMNQRLSPYYVHWVSVRAEGARPVIEILPYGISMNSIIDGSKDAWLVALRKQINRPVVLSFGPEADGTWYQWSKNPAMYRQAWRHVVHMIGHHDVTWMWQQSARPDMSAHHLLSYWPGPRWVDWIGLDGYINRRGVDFQVRFGAAISELRRTRKRILLSETSVGQNAGRVVYDIASLFAGIRKDHLLGLIWFDEVKLGNKLHWELENRPAALAAFRRDAASVARMK